MTNRGTMNFNALQQQLFLNLFENISDNKILKEKEEVQSDDQEEILTVYLGESDKKQFNRFILDTLTQVQNYYKLSIFVDPSYADKFDELPQEIIKNKDNGLEV